MLTEAGAGRDATPSSGAAGAWRGQLSLGFAATGLGATRTAKTWLVSRRHSGPLQVQRCFHPERGGCCHVYVVHPPGGLAGGDELALDVAVDENAAALLTTPAATKLYRARPGFGPSLQTQLLKVAAGGSLEWLPQETILFRGARGQLRTRVELAAGASFLGWEVLCLGRPAANERFDEGRLLQHLDVWREDEPVVIERWEIDAADPASSLGAPWGLHGRSTYGTFVAVGPAPGDGARSGDAADEDLLSQLRALAGLDPESHAPSSAGAAWKTVTRLGGAWVLRYLGDSAPEARDWFGKAWTLLRPALLGREACAPRIWAT